MTTATSELLATSEAARLLGVAADTVRLWERRGLLPAERTAGGIRLFRLEDVERLATERAGTRGTGASG